MINLTDLEWLTVESALCDAMAFYGFESSNLLSTYDMENLERTGKVLTKIRASILKNLEKKVTDATKGS